MERGRASESSVQQINRNGCTRNYYEPPKHGSLRVTQTEAAVSHEIGELLSAPGQKDPQKR